LHEDLDEAGDDYEPKERESDFRADIRRRDQLTRPDNRPARISPGPICRSAWLSREGGSRTSLGSSAYGSNAGTVSSRVSLDVVVMHLPLANDTWK
jgi:hypothetical protein